MAIDLQGLLKSAVLARMSGASRVLGFSIWHLREKTARPFYTATGGDVPESAPAESTGPAAGDRSPGSDRAPDGDRSPVGDSSADRNRSFRLQPEVTHVIAKNLRLVRTLGVRADEPVTFPLAAPHSPALDAVRATPEGRGPFALLNPGAAWPNKRWPAERFGEIAAVLHEVRGLPAFVLWGPGEEPLARAVVEASNGAARMAPPTDLPDLLALCRAASVIVSGDTGPLHLAAAVGTPAVAIFGPTDPARNGPWSAEDLTISRFGSCRCHYQRRCHETDWCLGDISVAEVTAALQRRLGGERAVRRSS